MSKKVLVLGAGPAGLMAAHAAALKGCGVMIFSKQSRKSRMFGAQYLHYPIPIASTDEPELINYQLWGTPDGYRHKVYGPRLHRGEPVKVSPETLSGKHSSWDIRVAYDWLWETYGPYVKDAELGDNGRTIIDLLDWAKPDLAISTVPAEILCVNPGHSFSAEYIWSTSSENPVFGEIPDNTVICNGNDENAWYRYAHIRGHYTIEWPEDRRPPLPDLHHVTKPLWTNCNCFPDIHRMGRYGRWEKGVLSHSAYFETEDLLNDPEGSEPTQPGHAPESLGEAAPGS